MAVDSDLTPKIIDLYRRICSAIDSFSGDDASDSSSGNDSEGIVGSMRSLCVELGSLLNVEDEEYPPGIADRIRVIEREISTLISRSRSASGKKKCMSL